LVLNSLSFTMFTQAMNINNCATSGLTLLRWNRIKDLNSPKSSWSTIELIKSTNLSRKELLLII
jgi:hypothetical protein